MLYLFIIFLSAFLLFQVQPLIAKLVLPFFGGGAAIWTACLLFFQGFLLLGYLYAHGLTKIKSLKVQVIVHGALLALSLFLLPIADNISVHLQNVEGQAPLTAITSLLLITVGLPYFMVSTTGPLIQRWRSIEHSAKLPYKLYSLSNIGSLLALLSYPFIFEPSLTLPNQLSFWSIGYGAFVIALIVLCYRLAKQSQLLTTQKDDLSSTHVSGVVQWQSYHPLLWLAFSALGVVILVATTNAMTQNIPPVPFLWIFPLALYLLTFIICFHSSHWYVRWYWFALFSVAAFAAILMFFIGSQFDIISQVLIYGVILFSACMICHGEIVKLTPKVERLTQFYLCLSLGGFLGSAFVTFIAQAYFDAFYEFPLAIILIALLLGGSSLLSNGSEQTQSTSQRVSQRHLIPACSIGVAILLTLTFSYLKPLFYQHAIESSRNFYGVLQVKDVEVNGLKERRLIDGTTSHGTQALDERRAAIPMSYYRKDTGAALALEHLFLQREKHVAIVGLGAGTLATYGAEGDVYRFFELNPDVERMAKQYFSYIESSDANVDVVLGDGRVSLQAEQSQAEKNVENVKPYQVMVLDAFSGDSIPAHLLTEQALALYWQRLAKDGILAVHISNSHLDLTPLMRGLARSQDKTAIFVETKATATEVNDAQWVLITSNQSFINHRKVKRLQSPWPNDNADVLWTDDYSNLLSVLK